MLPVVFSPLSWQPLSSKLDFEMITVASVTSSGCPAKISCMCVYVCMGIKATRRLTERFSPLMNRGPFSGRSRTRSRGVCEA